MNAGNMESTYQHAPLRDTRSIRLLKIIDPRPSSLAIRLESFHLDKLPTFEALSYTWGKAIRDEDESGANYDLGTIHPVKCGGGLFSVTENLFDALIQLSPAGYLWVDALCIDQTNFGERSSQILLMGEIYSAAERVIAWLGKDVSDLDDFLWVHEVFVQRIDELLELDDNQVLKTQAVDLGVLQKLDVSLGRWLKYWKSYGSFYHRRRWFSRSWIIQEACLGREVIVRCGQYSLEFEKMMSLVGFLRFMTNWWSELVTVKAKSTMSHDPIHLLMVSRNTVQYGGPEAYESLKQSFISVMRANTPEERWYCYLQFLIQCTRRHEASDLHDKIYGVLGVAKRFLPSSMENPITPDYCQEVEKVYRSVSSLMVEHIPILSVLSFVEDHSERRIQCLPSWSPDYGSLSNAAPLVTLTRSNNSVLFDASGALGLGRLQRSIYGPVLTLPGKQFDTVSGVCIPMEELISEHWIEPIFEICLGLDEMYEPTCQDRLEVLWRTIILDTVIYPWANQVSHPAEATIVTQFCDWVLFQCAQKMVSFGKTQEESTYLSIVSRRNEAFRNSLVNLPSTQQVAEYAKLTKNLQIDMTDSKSTVKPDWMTRVSEFHRTFLLQACGRCLFLTSQKNFGLGPKSMQEGDEVWLLQGAPIPFILRLRQDEQRYTLVGEAYVHGFMHGEMLDIPNFKSGIGPVHIV